MLLPFDAVSSHSIALTPTGDVAPGQMRGVDTPIGRLLLVNVEGRVCAFHDRCPHRGVELSRGELVGGVVRCGMHGWTFDGQTGRALDPAGVALTPVVVAVEAGMVCLPLALPPASASVKP